MQKKANLPITALIVCLFQVWTSSALYPARYYSGRLAFMAVNNGKFSEDPSTCNRISAQPVDVPVLRPAFVYLSSGIGLYAVTEDAYAVISVTAYYKSDSFGSDSFTADNVGNLRMSDLQVDENERFQLVQTRTSEFVGTFSYLDIVEAKVTINCEKRITQYYKFPGREPFSQVYYYSTTCGRSPLPDYMLEGAEHLKNPCCN